MGYTSTTTTVHEVTCDRCGTVSTHTDDREVAKHWYRVWVKQYHSSEREWAYDLCYTCYSSGMMWFDDLATDDNLSDDDGLADWERYLLGKPLLPEQETVQVTVSADDLWRVLNWYETHVEMGGVVREDTMLATHISRLVAEMED